MSKKVLIIEDDKVLSEMYMMKFQKEGFEVMPAYDGLAGLTKITTFQPDAILLDIMMPGMNGFETLEAIKEQSSSKCKIVMFTNIIDKDKIEQAIKMGADDYLIKSDTTPKEAVEKIDALLEAQGIQETEEETGLPKINYLNPGVNQFKIKNPNGGDDIHIEINIK